MHGSVDSKLYIQPLGFLRGCIASRAVESVQARWLAGGEAHGFSQAFTLVRVLFRHEGIIVEDLTLPVGDIEPYRMTLSSFHQQEFSRLMHHLEMARPAMAHLAMECLGGAGSDGKRPMLQGIVNVTPDSFSDGGNYDQAEKAVRHGLELMDAGADIIDIGGESTRPGAVKVTIEEELSRVIPVIEQLAARSVPLSIDSRNAPVMSAALDVGASLVNDVSALSHDPAALGVVAAANCPVILMHAQNTPDVMQEDPQYNDVVLEVYDYLEQRIAKCRSAGIGREKIMVDPGIGFGKTLSHNLALLANVSLFHSLGVPLLLGTSRKSFIGTLTETPVAAQRLAGSLTTGLSAWNQGVQILRVHDVLETRQARDVWEKSVL